MPVYSRHDDVWLEARFEDLDSLCICTRVSLNDYRLKQDFDSFDDDEYEDEHASESVMASSSASTADVKGLTEQTATENDHDEEPDIPFEGEYSEDAELMKQMGLPLSFSSRTAVKKKKREKKRGKSRKHDGRFGYCSSHRSKKIVDREIESEWQSYWQLHGQAIILNSWIDKYREYINPEFLAAHGKGKELSRNSSQEEGAPGDDLKEDVCAAMSQVREKFSGMSFSEQKDKSPPSDQESETKHSSGGSTHQSKDETDSEAMNVDSDVIVKDKCNDVAQNQQVESDAKGSGDKDSKEFSFTIPFYGHEDEIPLILPEQNYQNMFNPKCHIAITTADGKCSTVVGEQSWGELWDAHNKEQYDYHYKNFKETYYETDYYKEAKEDLCLGTDISCEFCGEYGCDYCFKEDYCDRLELSNVDYGLDETSLDVEYDNNSPIDFNFDCAETDASTSNVDFGDDNASDTAFKSSENLAAGGSDTPPPEVSSCGNSFDDQAGASSSGIMTAGSSSAGLSNIGGAGGDSDDDDEPDTIPIRIKRCHEEDNVIAENEDGERYFQSLGFVVQPSKSISVSVKGNTVHSRFCRFHSSSKRMHVRFREDGVPNPRLKSHVLSKVMKFLNTQQAMDETMEDIPDMGESSEAGTITAEEVMPHSPQNTCTVETDGAAGENTETEKESDSSLQHVDKKLRPTENVPSEVSDLQLSKYWHQRYRLFSLFDEGIKLDKESWFSVTPEEIAKHVAERCRCDVIIDAFCGAGGNAIQFAFTCNHVIAIDIDPVKIEMAKNNAKVYGVDKMIDFVVADYLDIAASLKADAVFLSPRWGGPEYLADTEYDISNIDPDIFKVFEVTKKVTQNIALFVPRTTIVNQLVTLAGKGKNVEVEQNILNKKVKTITAYYGELINTESDS